MILNRFPSFGSKKICDNEPTQSRLHGSMEMPLMISFFDVLEGFSVASMLKAFRFNPSSNAPVLLLARSRILYRFVAAREHYDFCRQNGASILKFCRHHPAVELQIFIIIGVQRRVVIIIFIDVQGRFVIIIFVVGQPPILPRQTQRFRTRY